MFFIKLLYKISRVSLERMNEVAKAEFLNMRIVINNSSRHRILEIGKSQVKFETYSKRSMCIFVSHVRLGVG